MTGVGIYALRMLEAVHALNETVGILLPSGSPYAGFFSRFQIHFTRVNLTAHPLTDAFEQFFIPFLCYRHGYRSFVSFEGRVPAIHPGLKTFSFVYDLSFLKVKKSHSFKYSAFLYLILKISSFTATRIVTISNSVRLDLIKLAGVPGYKVFVAYPASTQLGRVMSIQVRGLIRPYFLTVGMTNDRKNLSNLIKAFTLFRKSAPEFSLAITGNTEMIDRECGLAAIVNVVNLGFVSEGALRGLYENAQALVYPSFDEGFGIPLIDAMEFNCPVLCSDIPVFREVAGDAAQYFDPHSPESICQCMAAFNERPDPEKTKHVANMYSWKKSAITLFREVRKAHP